MPLQATSGAASYDAFGGGVPVVPKYIEDYFSTYLVTGDGTAPAVNNGIDLSTKGGLVWIKKRSAAGSHDLFDTARGANLRLISNNTAAQDSKNLSFTTTGFSNYTLDSGVTYTSWSWAKAPKFFDVVTLNYTSGAAVFNHSLGSVPGFVILKVSSGYADNWWVYHRSLGNDQYVNLNLTSAAQTSTGIFSATDTTFTVKNGIFGASTIVAYLFAHDAGGFGLTGTDNVISCGSYTGNSSSTGPVVTLGYEPQWLMVKDASANSDWFIIDNMRGLISENAGAAILYPNLSSSEFVSGANIVTPTATGFKITTTSNAFNFSGRTYIYIAIRRGPMKTPTVGTSVFSPVAETPSGSANYVMNSSSGFPVDMLLYKERNNVATPYLTNRLTNNYLQTASTAAEASYTYGYDLMQGVRGQFNAASQVDYAFRRAPSFFDVVCYTGTGTPTNFTHNLGVAPELVIVKVRSSSGDNWFVLNTSGTARLLRLNSSAEDSGGVETVFGNGSVYIAPTSTNFTVGGFGAVNQSGSTFVAYLFATCAGVSKCGTFTGNGSSQTINCGFTGGARFVMIKATSTTGDWMVADSARGIVSGNDPYLELNNTNAEVTGEDWLDTDSTGFVVNEVSGSNANTNGVTYIYLAIA